MGYDLGKFLSLMHNNTIGALLAAVQCACSVLWLMSNCIDMIYLPLSKHYLQ